MKDPMVIYVDRMQVVKKKINRGWYVVWILAAILYGVVIVHPDWVIIPPFIHDIKVTL